MYTPVAASFIFRRRAFKRSASSIRSASEFVFTSPFAPGSGAQMPFGFCCGGYPPPPVTFRSERRSTEVERLCFSLADQFPRAPPVFIRAHRESLPTFSSQPFGCEAGVSDRDYPLILVSHRTARRRIHPHLPAFGRVPLSVATGGEHYSRRRRLSIGFQLTSRQKRSPKSFPLVEKNRREKSCSCCDSQARRDMRFRVHVFSVFADDTLTA
jgi:hypothetical protein